MTSILKYIKIGVRLTLRAWKREYRRRSMCRWRATQLPSCRASEAAASAQGSHLHGLAAHSHSHNCLYYRGARSSWIRAACTYSKWKGKTSRGCLPPRNYWSKGNDDQIFRHSGRRRSNVVNDLSLRPSNRGIAIQDQSTQASPWIAHLLAFSNSLGSCTSWSYVWGKWIQKAKAKL